MHLDLLRVLVCPSCQGDLTLEAGRVGDGVVESGMLRCRACPEAFPIVRFVPRFVSPDNYTSNFGFQWNHFRSTQLDSTTGQPITRSRFFEQSGWSPADITGRWTLDVGCGAGRFAEIALGTGARLVAVDYSEAVDACHENLGTNDNLDVVQADIYRLPFRRRSFDFVYCFGVLQHTPDVRAAVAALAGQLRTGGRIAVDVYPQIALNIVWPKYWLRPLTRRMRPERLFAMVQAAVALLWPMSLALGRVPGVGRRLRHMLPIANYDGVLPLSPAQLKEWAVLDTFDMLAPVHDHPQSTDTLRRWLEDAALTDIDVFRRGLVIGRGREPARLDGIASP